MRLVALLAITGALLVCVGCGGGRTWPRDSGDAAPLPDASRADAGDADGTPTEAAPTDAPVPDDATPTTLIVTSPTVQLFAGPVGTFTVGGPRSRDDGQRAPVG